MKLLATATACIFVIAGSLAISAKEPQENPEELDRASKDELNSNDTDDNTQSRERALRAQQEALKAQHAAQEAHEKAIKAQEEATRKSREAMELQEWQEGQFRRSEEARAQFIDAFDSIKTSRDHLNQVFRVAPLIDASRYSIDSIGNDLTNAFQNRVATTTGGFIGIDLGETTSQGVVIDEVLQHSPAESSGLQTGDVVSLVDGSDIRKAKDPVNAIIALIRSVSPGSEVELEIVRNKKKITVPVTVGPRSSQLVRSAPEWGSFAGAISSIIHHDRQLVLLEFEDELGHYFGMEFGILVVDTPKESKLQVGDVLLRIDDKPVRSISHAERFLRSAEETTEFTVKRRGKTQKLEVASSGLHISDVREM